MVTISVSFVLSLMVLVSPMINYKQFYQIDDIVLSNFCANSNKLNKSDKYVAFKKYLHSFHPISEIYEGSLSNYAAYIINSILLNSLELNKNILTYEQYFYNVINGFSLQSGYKISSISIAKYWSNLVQVYDELISEISRNDVKEVRVLQKAINPVRYINFSVVNNSYYWDIPVQLVMTDDTLKNILIIPHHPDLSILSNLLVLNTINRFPKDALTVLQISLDSINIKLINMNLTDNLRRTVYQYFEKFYIDFSTANITNCSICPVRPCTYEQMFKVVQPTTVHKMKKIKLVNE